MAGIARKALGRTGLVVSETSSMPSCAPSSMERRPDGRQDIVATMQVIDAIHRRRASVVAIKTMAELDVVPADPP